MCLVVLAWQSHPRYRLVLAGNRDEFHARAAAPLHRWEQPADFVAGRDLEAGGTWLGFAASGRFGVVTNFREPGAARGARSRGELIPEFAAGEASPLSYARTLTTAPDDWSGFNLLVGDRDSLAYTTNRPEPRAITLPPGRYGVSNHQLDTPWPKLVRVRSRFESLLDASAATGSPLEPETLLALLADPTPAADADLPRTGVSLEWERQLSAPFIIGERYGTRCSTVLLVDTDGGVTVVERTYDATGRPTGERRESLAVR